MIIKPDIMLVFHIRRNRCRSAGFDLCTPSGCVYFRLGTGWSVRTNRNRYAYLEAPSPDTLSQEELQSIKSVIKKAETFEKVEKERIGLVFFTVIAQSP